MANNTTQYLYQNAQTGASSATPLSRKILCRMLTSKASSVISLDTMVISLDVSTNTYGGEGWLPIRSVPILNEAASQWYYQSDNNTVEGPLNCRELAELSLPVATQVYNASDSSGGKAEWKRIKDLDFLRAAFEAFHVEETSSASMHDHVAIPMGAKEMVYGDENEETAEESENRSAELEAFLASTGTPSNPPSKKETIEADDEEDDEEGYTTDGGTEYVRCKSTGTWVEASLMRRPVAKRKVSAQPVNMKKTEEPSPTTLGNKNAKKRKKVAKFAAKKAKNWVYVTNLPQDIEEDELSNYFSRAGIIDLDPDTQLPKIKIYRFKKGDEGIMGIPKGDASICYARPESVELAINILDESMIRATSEKPIRVSKAKFEQKGEVFVKSNVISVAKRKVAKLAAVQAVCWDESENGRITGGLKGLRIIVIKGLFKPKSNENNDSEFAMLERKVHAECSKYGDVEKITVFSKNIAGVVIVKFAQPAAASAAIKGYHNLHISGRKLEATFWDGVTDYTTRDEEQEVKETEERHDAFGKWLDSQQELPEHLRLRVEGAGR